MTKLEKIGADLEKARVVHSFCLTRAFSRSAPIFSSFVMF